MTTVDIIKPNINATTESGQLSQIRTYLYQVSEQLNWALNTISSDNASSAVTIEKTGGASKSPEEVQASFNDIKSLIIKSADIVEAYYSTISKRLTGEYKALSEFGDYSKKVDALYEIGPEYMKTKFENVESINSTLDELGSNLNTVIENTAYITVGKVYDNPDGGAVYGLKIGQKDTANGEEVFNQFATFTADRLSFYDNNGTEVAYISDTEMVITNAKIKYALLFGEVSGYKLDSSDGLAFIWEDSHPVYGKKEGDS